VRIGVAIPVYNRAAIILETLRSVAQQSLKPTSLIVVDDGSKDGSADTVQAWFDREGACLSGRVIHYSHNGGASVARNVGFARLRVDKCDAIAFLDSDDVWPHEFLACAAEALEREPDAVAAFANSVQIVADGAVVRQVARELCADPLSHIFGKECALLSCGLFRVSAVRQCRPFDPLLVTGQDTPFMIDLARQGRWLPLDCPPVQRGNLTHAMNIEGHLSDRFPDRFTRWAKMFHQELTHLSPCLNRADKWQLRRYTASRWINAADEAVQFGYPGRAMICCAKALWLASLAGLPRRTEQPLAELAFPCLRLTPREVAGKLLRAMHNAVRSRTHSNIDVG
jgi:Glycosyl transferase family 2